MFQRSYFASVAALLCLQVSTSFAQATISGLNACPGTPVSGITSNGYKYQICNNSDYQGPSDNIIQGIASITDCLQLCANDTKCTRAVWDTQGGACHFKTTQGNLVWASSDRFHSAQMNTVVGRSVINKCPYTESTYTTAAGVKLQVCAGTDFEGTSLQILQNVASVTDCDKICEATNGCTKTVYDVVYSVCHIKADDGNLVWATNRQFITSRIVTVPDKSKFGSWSDIITLPVIPVAGYVVPQADTARVLFWSSYAATNFGDAKGYTQFADYNFKTGAVSQRTVSNTQHDMFCPGISQLSDGRVIITGGANAAVTSIYDPASNAFTRGPDMKIPRGYQTSATLSNGKVFTIGGSFSGGIGGKTGEVYDPATNTWSLISGADPTPMLTTYDAEGAWRTDNHAWLFGWKNGAVFQAGPSKTMHWYSTTGNGGVVEAGTRDPNNDAMCGVHAMYDSVQGKIFSAGGSQSYTNSPSLSRAYITTINNPNTPATVEQVSDLNYARGFANAVVLPDGTVLITGGQLTTRVFTDIQSVLVPELFNPTTKTFTKLASASVPRNYHAISILLPDATVLTGGGGLCYNPNNDPNANCDRSVDHANVEIFTPPYLYTSSGAPAVRPIISSVSSPTSSSGIKVRVGSTLTVRMSTSATFKFSLVRIGSVTHSVNSDQRRVPLTNVRTVGSQSTITLPADSGVLIPGFYYLFAINAAGVPSLAKVVQVTL